MKKKKGIFDNVSMDDIEDLFEEAQEINPKTSDLDRWREEKRKESVKTNRK